MDEEVFKICRRCGGELMHRIGLDVESIIWRRLDEFADRTVPAINVARERGILVHELDAEREEKDVYKDIAEKLEEWEA